MQKNSTTAIALFSGGLDSILACRLVMEQGIAVKAVRFVSPFFGYELLAEEEEYVKEIYYKYGIDLSLQDISVQYLAMLRNPPHGYGKNFNPCIDCKILLMREAKKMMMESGASFLISGEVLGQRPMSQRKDALKTIERDGGCEGILLRPLSAKNLAPVRAELNGIIDREQLLDFTGRGRVAQMELAEKYEIHDYPTPAGGCLLTESVIAARIENFYKEHDVIEVSDINLLMVGRHFKLPDGGWLTMGRNQAENKQLETLCRHGDWLLRMENRPGPSAILSSVDPPHDFKTAASLVVRYGRKTLTYAQEEALVTVSKDGRVELTVAALPISDERFQDWLR